MYAVVAQPVAVCARYSILLRYVTAVATENPDPKLGRQCTEEERANPSPLYGELFPRGLPRIDAEPSCHTILLPVYDACARVAPTPIILSSQIQRASARESPLLSAEIKRFAVTACWSGADSNRRCREKSLRRKTCATVGEISGQNLPAPSREQVRLPFGTMPVVNLKFRSRENAGSKNSVHRTQVFRGRGSEDRFSQLTRPR